MGLTSKFYSKKNLRIIKIFSLIAIFILTFAIIKIIITGVDYESFNIFIEKKLEAIILDTLSIICFIFLFIYPEKVITLSILSFIYTLLIFINEPGNIMGLLMSFLCFQTLYIRNFFSINKKTKIIILVTIFSISFMTQIRFGKTVFLKSLIDTTAALFILSVVFFLFKEKNIIEIKNSLPNKKLNIFPYPGTKKDDVKLLQLVLEKKQYLEISQAVYRSEGTIRNRLNKLYDILGVADKIGFITTYNGYKVIYDDTELEEIANNN